MFLLFCCAFHSYLENITAMLKCSKVAVFVISSVFGSGNNNFRNISPKVPAGMLRGESGEPACTGDAMIRQDLLLS